MEDGVHSSYNSILFPDRETEAETLSISLTVTKLRCVWESDLGWIKSKFCWGITSLCGTE